MPNEKQFTKEEITELVQVAFKASVILGEAVRDLGSVPKGALYARVMDVMPLNVFDRLVEMLIKANLVSESNSVLTWIGPKPNEIPAGKVGIA